MFPLTDTINFIAALGTLTLGVLAIVMFATHVTHRNKPHHILDKVTMWLLWLGLGVAGLSIVASLIYSGVIGYPPCVLCWWQRVMIYPQVILYGIALLKEDKNIFRYTLALSLIGVVFSIYHNYLDFGGSALIACDAAVSCTARYVNEFGFVTIPLMSLLSLFSLTIIAWIGLERSKHHIKN